MKNYTVLLFQILIANVLHAQAPDWQWAKSIGGTHQTNATSMAVDASGNSYSAGRFEGTVDFDPGPGVFNITSAFSDFFILKLDSSGNFIWVKTLSGTGYIENHSMIIDASGNIYTTGSFSDTADFDPGPGTFNLISSGFGDFYILKLERAGNFSWAKSIGSVDEDISWAIASDAVSNVYLTGKFSDTVDFDPGPAVFNLTVTGGVDCFILKLDASGNFVWAKQINGIGVEEGFSIAVDFAGNNYVTGRFTNTVDFDPGPGIFNLTSMGDFDIFICKLNSAGNFVWAKACGETYTDQGNGISLDSYGNVFTTGNFYGTVDFDPGAGTYNITSAGVDDIFVLKLDTSGNFKWARAMGGNASDVGNSVAVDNSGKVYTTGHFDFTADFDPGAGTFNLISTGNADVFVSALDSSGNFMWAKSSDGLGLCDSRCIIVDASGHINIIGWFWGPSITFDPFVLMHAGGTNVDCFITRIDTGYIQSGIAQENLVGNNWLFPNPATDNLTIDLGNVKNADVAITDVAGRIIFATTTNASQKIELSTINFAEGIYFVRIHAGDYLRTKKFMVVK
jgi:hypothetical protein